MTPKSPNGTQFGKADPFDDVGGGGGRQHQRGLVVECRIEPASSLVVAGALCGGPRPDSA